MEEKYNGLCFQGQLSSRPSKMFYSKNVNLREYPLESKNVIYTGKVYIYTGK